MPQRRLDVEGHDVRCVKLLQSLKIPGPDSFGYLLDLPAHRGFVYLALRRHRSSSRLSGAEPWLPRWYGDTAPRDVRAGRARDGRGLREWPVFQVPARQTVRARGSPAHRLPAFFTVGVQPARASPGRAGRGDDGGCQAPAMPDTRQRTRNVTRSVTRFSHSPPTLCSVAVHGAGGRRTADRPVMRAPPGMAIGC